MKRLKQAAGVIGIVFVVGFLVVSPRYIGEELGISPVAAALGVIAVYFGLDQLYNHREEIRDLLP